jgi:DNA-binding protein HU-beta
MSVNRADLVSRVADLTGLTKKDSHSAVSAVFEVITQALNEKETVNVTGFGRFTPRVRPAGQSRNPKTGEQIQVGERTVVSFKTGKTLKDSVN